MGVKKRHNKCRHSKSYCPANAMARAETYNTDELMSSPHTAVAASSDNFLCFFISFSSNSLLIFYQYKIQL
tara:strand:- start:12058 stop:12270 length:213 start_codon:yes stop_codon:yes gene_type:complete